MEFIFFTTNVRPVTTLDDLRFMTSLPVVDLTRCRRCLIFIRGSDVAAVATGVNLCKGVLHGRPDVSIFAELDAAFVGIAQQRKPPEARVDMHCPSARPPIYHRDAPSFATTLADWAPHSNVEPIFSNCGLAMSTLLTEGRDKSWEGGGGGGRRGNALLPRRQGQEGTLTKFS